MNWKRSRLFRVVILVGTYLLVAVGIFVAGMAKRRFTAECVVDVPWMQYFGPPSDLNLLNAAHRARLRLHFEVILNEATGERAARNQGRNGVPINGPYLGDLDIATCITARIEARKFKGRVIVILGNTDDPETSLLLVEEVAKAHLDVLRDLPTGAVEERFLEIVRTEFPAADWVRWAEFKAGYDQNKHFYRFFTPKWDRFASPAAPDLVGISHPWLPAAIVGEVLWTALCLLLLARRVARTRRGGGDTTPRAAAAR